MESSFGGGCVEAGKEVGEREMRGEEDEGGVWKTAVISFFLFPFSFFLFVEEEEEEEEEKRVCNVFNSIQIGSQDARERVKSLSVGLR